MTMHCGQSFSIAIMICTAALVGIQAFAVLILGECRALWGEHEQASCILKLKAPSVVFSSIHVLHQYTIPQHILQYTLTHNLVISGITSTMQFSILQYTTMQLAYH